MYENISVNQWMVHEKAKNALVMNGYHPHLIGNDLIRPYIQKPPYRPVLMKLGQWLVRVGNRLQSRATFNDERNLSKPVLGMS